MKKRSVVFPLPCQPGRIGDVHSDWGMNEYKKALTKVGKKRRAKRILEFMYGNNQVIAKLEHCSKGYEGYKSISLNKKECALLLAALGME